MTKERYVRFRALVTALNVCCEEFFLLAALEEAEDGELSDIIDILYSDLDDIVSELRQRLEFIEL